MYRGQRVPNANGTVAWPEPHGDKVRQREGRPSACDRAEQPARTDRPGRQESAGELRALHREWEHDARDAVAALRMEAAGDPDDPELARLVGELAVQDEHFRIWWAERRVNSAGYGTKHYHHAVAGDLTLDCETWTSPDGSGQRLMVLTAEPGRASWDGGERLGAGVFGSAGRCHLGRGPTQRMATGC